MTKEVDEMFEKIIQGKWDGRTDSLKLAKILVSFNCRIEKLEKG